MKAAQPVTVTLTEEQRQAVLLCLAHTSAERPGWDHMLNEIALLMDNRKLDGRAELYDRFREIRQTHAIL